MSNVLPFIILLFGTTVVSACIKNNLSKDFPIDNETFVFENNAHHWQLNTDTIPETDTKKELKELNKARKEKLKELKEVEKTVLIEEKMIKEKEKLKLELAELELQLVKEKEMAAQARYEKRSKDKTERQKERMKKMEMELQARAEQKANFAEQREIVAYERQMERMKKMEMEAQVQTEQKAKLAEERKKMARERKMARRESWSVQKIENIEQFKKDLFKVLLDQNLVKSDSEEVIITMKDKKYYLNGTLISRSSSGPIQEIFNQHNVSLTGGKRVIANSKVIDIGVGIHKDNSYNGTWNFKS
jgi:hypothetical protein